ncbi:MAG TPA: BMP family ABC transporter substrate-binding protein [Acidimicrobiales bacterium]|nr:BMP family ABC transporter substrate-binding protein [Acidimicrobiales bacterium]
MSRSFGSRRTRATGAALAAVALLAGACSSSTKSTTGTTSGGSSTTTASNGPWGWPGDATKGYLAPHEPDVNRDGKVVIGVISPGDTHDHGYYESFVDEADSFAKAQGWQVITVDKVPDSNAAQAARNMCQQHPDMIAIAASELKDAIPVASEAVCKDTVWYVAGGQGVTQTPYFVQTNDISSQDGYAAGVAAGLLMKAKGATKAGFITGPQASFTTDFAKAWEAGIKSQVPSESTVTTYTGDFNDSAKAVEAFQSMKSQGVGIVYPYLGGATFAVAAQANQANIPVLTPGTDNCSVPSPKFAISVIFSPGDYFAAALTPFKDGTLRVGTALVFHMGVDPVPTVKICSPTGDQAQVLAQTIHQIGTGQIRTDQITGLNDYNGYVPSGS